MTWEEMCADPNLRDLPFKIEQDRYGRVVMSPVSPNHGRLQGRINNLLSQMLPGWVVFVEGGVDSEDGTKSPDVSALPKERFGRINGKASLSEAPDLAVEVLSPANRPEEMNEKRRLFAARGCREFWTCSEDGAMTFCDGPTGKRLARSALCPRFPAMVSLE
ncbi:MAG: Uma2 family endonuclease [Opitutaceae bacterium]